jgi:hypothetical protein
MANGVFSQYIGDLAKVQSEFDTGDRNLGEYVLGTGYYGLARPVERLLEAVTPDLGVGQFIGEQIAKTGLPEYLQENTSEDTRRAVSESFGLFGITPLGRMGKTVVGSPADDAAMRGFMEGSGDVIIPNFYGPRMEPFSEPIERLLQTGKLKDPGWDVNKPFDENWSAMIQNPDSQNVLQNKIRKGLGVAKWGAKGAARVAVNLFNPEARARYRDFGITPVLKEAKGRVDDAVQRLEALEDQRPPMGSTEEVMKSYGKELRKAQEDVKSAIEVAHSQGQQLANIRVQAEAKTAGKRDMPEEFALAASDPSSPQIYFKPTEVQGGNWYEQMASQGATAGRAVSSKESSFVQNHIERVWGYNPENARIIVKKPLSYVTGAHFLDIVDKGSVAGPVKGHLFDVFAPTPKRGRKEFTVDSLKTALEKKSKVKDAQFFVQGADDTGVYIQVARKGRKGGRGKVEGGINLLMKVEPNGNITGYMSDLHDFLENVPVAGKYLARSLPTQVVAVSPPMQTNIYSFIAKKKVDRVYGEGTQSEMKVPRPEPEGGKAADYARGKERLDEMDGLTPSASSRAIETGKVAQNIAALGMPLEYSDPFADEDLQ